MSQIAEEFRTQDLCFGIDQSLNSSAYCVVATTGELLHYGLVRVNPNNDPKNKKRDVPILHPALEAWVEPEKWNGLAKQWQQFYLAKASAGMIVGAYSRFCFENGFMDNQNIVDICIENIGFGSTGDATRGLAGLQFLIIDEFIRDNEDWGNPNREQPSVDLAPPTTIKKFATGNGRADKEDLFNALPDEVKEIFGQIPKTKGRYDLTDAYFISLYGYDFKGKKHAT